MARPSVGPVTARTRAREAVAALAAERAQRDARIAACAEEWFKADDTITAAQRQLADAQDAQARAVGDLAAENVSVDDTAVLLGLDARDVRALRKRAKELAPTPDDATGDDADDAAGGDSTGDAGAHDPAGGDDAASTRASHAADTSPAP